MFQRIFVVTWLAYFGMYFCRKNFSILMPYLKSEQGFTTGQLADALFLYSVAYAIGQFSMGPLADRYGARLTVTVGMIVSAITSSLVGLVTPLTLVLGVNGAAQSAGWPGLLKMARDWFPSGNRGVVMGWWGTHMVLGGFGATWLAASVAESGWRRAAWVPSILLSIIAVVYLLGAKNGPTVMRGPFRPIWSPVKLNRPLVAIAAMYFFVKLTRYAFLFWLPLYMTEALSYDKPTAGYASSAFELIGFLGALLAGYISERFAGGGRFSISALMMFCLALFTVAYPYVSGQGYLANLAMIAMIGVFTFGPDTLMAGAAVHDVAPPESMAGAAGFVNGVGSVGQILSPYVVSRLSSQFGWEVLFAVLGIMAALGGIALLTQWQPEIRRLKAAQLIGATASVA